MKNTTMKDNHDNFRTEPAGRGSDKHTCAGGPAECRCRQLRLGDWNDLAVVRFTEHGAYLDGGDVGELLMPNAYLGEDVRVGDVLTVFVYLDQQERLVATTERPLARVGDFAYLRVAWVNEYGAFLDWGLMKDLFVPFCEQKMPMRQGNSYIVHVHIDEDTHRIVASAKVERWLRPAGAAEYYRGREVELLVQQKTPLGFKVIVDNAYQGLIYDNQIFGNEPHTGDRLSGCVVNVRPDGKIDVSPGRIGKSRFRDFADVLLEELEQAGGELPFTDDSTPEEISGRFGVSKKTFKRALGTLYRSRRVELSGRSVRLVRPKSEKKD